MTVSAATLAEGIGFDLPPDWNASRLLWDNLPGSAARPAIHHEGQSLSYGELAEEAGRIGSHLRDLGCAPGARVLLFLDDGPVYPAALMGAMRAGLVPMLINTLSTPDLVRFYLEDSGAVAAIVDRAFQPLFAPETVSGTPCARLLFAADRPWQDADPNLPEHPTQRTDMAFWLYSSGSTGRPKGVVHKHEDAAFVCDSYGAHILRIGPDDIAFSVPKIFFAYGLGNSVLFPMRVGAASVLLSGRPTPERIFNAAATHRPTLFFGLPTIYTALANDPGFAKADMASVRMFVSAAEVLSADLAARWRSRFDRPIVEGLGSTEMLHIYLSNDAGIQRPGAAGRVVPGYAVRLVPDETGDEAENGLQSGVMEVAGLSGAQYYWNRPDKTAETMRDGWLHTGDRFSVDTDGFYVFHGRADDLVKVSGQWVYPMEIEWALNEHPDVREACVAAVEMADKRMTIRAWIALKADAVASDSLDADLKSWVKARLLPHKYPREIVFLDTLPKTGTDKIDRQALRRLVV
jgi:benzoate-CoA ligase family protein